MCWSFAWKPGSHPLLPDTIILAASLLDPIRLAASLPPSRCLPPPSLHLSSSPDQDPEGRHLAVEARAAAFSLRLPVDLQPRHPVPNYRAPQLQPRHLPNSRSPSPSRANRLRLISVDQCEAFPCTSPRLLLRNELENSFSRQQQQQPEPNFQDISTQSWYPPSVVGSSSHPSTPTSYSASTHQRASDHPQSSSRGQPSPAEAAGIIARLKDKSVDELQRLLKDKEAYNAFFNSLDQVKTQNNLRDELRRETLQLARENLEREQWISELRNQCTIIRTTELATAEDRLADLERQKDEIMRSYSPAALLTKLQSTMAKLDEESEELHQKFLEKDIDLPTFVQKYKKLRAAHHKCSLLHLAGTTSLR